MTSDLQTEVAAVAHIVRRTTWLCEALKVVRDVAPAGAYVAAGAVRDTVWSFVTGRPCLAPEGDVDVVHWSDAEGPDASQAHEARLRAALPDFDWDLLGLRLRHNAAQAEAAVFWNRVESKRWLQRWPELQVVSAVDRAV